MYSMLRRRMVKVVIWCFALCAMAVVEATSHWTLFQEEILSSLPSIPGWCSDEKALVIMDLLHRERCQTCVEIGVFAGKSLFPIAKALQFNGEGTVYAIDAWDTGTATKGFSPHDLNYLWWSQLDLDTYYHKTWDLILKSELAPYCQLLKMPSQEAVALFGEGSIDFIHFDGNHNEAFVFQDVTAYFPKVREGGYLLLTDPNWLSMMTSLVYLLERSEVITPFTPSASFLLFRKTGQRIERANSLMDSKP